MINSKITTLVFIAALGIAYGNSAKASYVEGLFSCKNRMGLPNNTYSVKTVSVGGVSVPHVEGTRHFRSEPANPNSPIDQARISGFAAVSETTRNTVLMVAALKLEFDGNKLVGCEQ